MGGGASANLVGRASRRKEGACGKSLGDKADTGSPAFVPEGLRRGEARLQRANYGYANTRRCALSNTVEGAGALKQDQDYD